MHSKLDLLSFDHRYFQWTDEHDVIMCREVILVEPYQFKIRTPERGNAWDRIANNLNAVKQLEFRVNARSVRDRYNLLTSRHAQKIRAEEKASGIEVERESELGTLLEDILEREKHFQDELDKQDANKQKKVENEKMSAESVRKKAMERMSKRKEVGDSADEVQKKKSRKSTADAIDYLREKSSREHELRKQEIQQRKQEQEQSFNQQQDMMKVLLNQVQQQQQQQQNFQAFLLAQQQQQSDLLKALIIERKKLE